MWYRFKILDNCFTDLVFCGLSYFHFGCHFLTLSTTWKEIEIVEKEEDLPVFDTDMLRTFFFFFFFFTNCGN